MKPGSTAKPLLSLLALAATFLGGACTSYSHYRFSPSVHDVEVRDRSEAVLARILIAPRGIHEHQQGDSTQLDVRFRLKIENHTSTELTLVPEEFELVDANLRSFGPVDIRPSPDAKGVFQVHFPFPPGARPKSMDLRTVRLRLGLLHGQELLTPTASFNRDYGYRDAYYYPDVRWSVGFGYGVCF